MQLSDFDYDLPAHLIAQTPAAERDRARLLVVERSTGRLSHRSFHDLPELLRPGDLLVLNDTRVLPARLIGRRAATGGRWEGLFLRTLSDGNWELLCQTRGRLKEGEIILVEPGPLPLRLMKRNQQRNWLAHPEASGTAVELLQRHGQVPLPPYIRKGQAQEADTDRYQTVYARQAGAVAAPTAGLHFTPHLLERLQEIGVERAFVTLHVGAGTFQPIRTDDIAAHPMHEEWGQFSAETAAAIVRCKQRGGRVVAVGTTTVRVLETVAATGSLREWSGATALYIYPPYRFQAVDALITNFHLPRTSLLVLVSAFAGIKLIRRAYQTAIEESYRFYSYGDATLIV